MNRQYVETELKSNITELLPILKKNNNVENVGYYLFCSQAGNTTVKIMTIPEEEKFDAPAKLLLSQKEISKNFSEEFIHKKLVDYYHKLLSDESKIDEYVKELVNLLISNSLKDYFVASEVENIQILGDHRYDFVDSTIKLLKEEDLPFKKEEFKPLSSDRTILNKPSIFTKVKAGESEKAKEIAVHNFMISFNLIRLYAPQFKPFLKGCLLLGSQELMVYDEINRCMTTSLSTVGDLPLNHAYLSKEFYNQLIDAGINGLKEICSISKVVRECLYWWGLGLDEKHPSAKLLNFVMVLESILKRKGERTELRKAVSERGAILLSNQFEERKVVVKQLKEIYDMRSKVVHTGVLIGDKDIASLSGGYAKAVLRNLIEMSKDFNGNFDEFITYLDDMKLRGKPYDSHNNRIAH
ncbi:MAG: hypothetical protein EMLJLAPB_00978 [Candidatus Argoarchaeum ethanivorans]|uniref:Apea-like HEPN domain-containing protein n=1 Tax=Candidatus Argoarchaeum ethanivorans TaxID=2608793 RepID=A0A811TK64_9EURY|nr:MAG: hypothetical protein EMLJLAPB_00978 [Candidatus Argoarchaeum ethanivorans]